MNGDIQTCRICGCTDNDCTQCFEVQGFPCYWVKEDLCSRCDHEKKEKVIDAIFNELIKAEAKHPGWPDDKIHAVAIMIEAAGEAMQAAIDCVYSGGDIELLRKELAQTGAMAIRALIHL